MRSSTRTGDDWIALTGTPGTGKSSVAHELQGEIAAFEVADLALATGTGRRVPTGVSVELDKLSRRLPERPEGPYPAVAVGHLAHLLPVPDVVLLRCHPVELARRLRKEGRRRSEIDPNVAAEATDVILIECVSAGRRVWEVDTTRRSPRAVAAAVRPLLRSRPSARYGRLDWLADPSVTARLLSAVG